MPPCPLTAPCCAVLLPPSSRSNPWQRTLCLPAVAVPFPPVHLPPVCLFFMAVQRTRSFSPRPGGDGLALTTCSIRPCPASSPCTISCCFPRCRCRHPAFPTPAQLPSFHSITNCIEVSFLDCKLQAMPAMEDAIIRPAGRHKRRRALRMRQAAACMHPHHLARYLACCHAVHLRSSLQLDCGASCFGSIRSQWGAGLQGS